MKNYFEKMIFFLVGFALGVGLVAGTGWAVNTAYQTFSQGEGLGRLKAIGRRFLRPQPEARPDTGPAHLIDHEE